MMPLIEKSAWQGALPPFKRKEMQQIIEIYLEKANLSPKLFEEPVIEYIFKNANGSFTKALQLSESLLIDASIADSMIIKSHTMESPVKEHDLAYSSNSNHIQEPLSRPSQPLELASNPRAPVKFELDTAVEDITEKQLPQKLSPFNDISQSTPNQSIMNAQPKGTNASSEKDASLSIDNESPISLSKPKDHSASSSSSPRLELDIGSDLVNDALMPESSLNQNSIKTVDLTIDSLGESPGEPDKNRSSVEPGASPNQPNSASASKEGRPSVHENEPLAHTKKSDEKETPKKGKKSRVKPKSQEPKQRQSLSSLTKPL
jgi:hypothetical protein